MDGPTGAVRRRRPGEPSRRRADRPRQGRTAGATAAGASRLLRGILAFIAGFTVIFTILGASASAVGRLFLTHQRTLETVSGILIVVFGAMLVAMAAGVGLPMALSGERRFAVRPSVLGRLGPAGDGDGVRLRLDAVHRAGPGQRAGPGRRHRGIGHRGDRPAAGLLARPRRARSSLTGLAFGRMTDVLARVRSRLRVVDLVGGAVLVVFGLLLLTGNVDVISAHIVRLAP